MDPSKLQGPSLKKLKTVLLESAFQQSYFYPCFFMNSGIICVVSVDDTIFARENVEELEKEIASLGVQ